MFEHTDAQRGCLQSMNPYFYIKPEVAGHLGDQTQMDNRMHPPLIRKLEYVFDDWSGDHLLACFPCYIVSDLLAVEFSRHNFTGFNLAHVKTTKSDLYAELSALQPCKPLPHFHWMQITGAPGADDFGVPAEFRRLVVSRRALHILKPMCPNDCDVFEYNGGSGERPPFA